MDLISILMTDGAAVLIAVILLLTSRMTRQNKTLSNKLFTLILYTIIFGGTMDYLSCWIDGATFPYSVPLFYIINSFMFPNAQIVSYLWLLFVYVHVTNTNVVKKALFFVAGLPLFITLILDISNSFTGLLFTMDADHFYVRGPLGTTGFIFGGIYMLITILIALFSYQSKEDYLFFPIFYFLVPAFLGTFIQLVFYYVCVVWLGVAIGVAAIFISLQNRLIFIDYLTGLNNRVYLNYYLQKIHGKKNSNNNIKPLLGGIMLDINSFKQINDKFGNSVGDTALNEAVSIIKNSVGKNDIVIRYSSDKFIVIIRTSSEETVKDAMNKIKDGAKAFSAKDYHCPYTISFSMGYGMYVLGLDSSDSFLSKIDANLSEEKRIRMPGS